MWANDDVVAFTRWLREGNLDRPPERRVGFYGLDVYSLWESLGELVGYLRQHQPDHVERALEACRCLEPYAEDPQAYARATRLVPTTCEPEVVSLLRDVLEKRTTAGAPVEGGVDGDADEAFAAEQNARAVVSAEAYYRAMVRGGPESWNLRDIHMADTLDRLVRHHEKSRGKRPVKAVVWEHNTHIGDARFTDMSDAGMVNVGQLVRQRYGERDTVLVGFASHHGSVVAARAWGDPAQRMQVPDARRGSLEAVLHERLDDESALFVFANQRADWALQERGHRAIGVVYRPEQEGWGNYVPSMLAGRYDALLWFDETSALNPLRPLAPGDGELEAWPFGA
jgi:erythromycin esterase-like protein